MNNPNPLVPQGSLERQSKNRSTVHIAILTIVSIHAVFFAGLLMQGCRSDEGKAPLQSAQGPTNETENTLPPLDTGYYSATQQVAQTFESAPVVNPIPAVPNDSTQRQPSLPELPPEGKTYAILKGDTLAKIAKANGVALSTLLKANPNVDPARLRLGSKIQIPIEAGVAPEALGNSEPAKATASAGSVYRVKAGETLTRIAKRHGVTVKALRTANQLKTDRLLVGQKLKLPTQTASAAKLTSTDPALVSPLSGTTGR